jgi:hypothetical protein
VALVVVVDVSKHPSAYSLVKSTLLAFLKKVSEDVFLSGECLQFEWK